MRIKTKASLLVTLIMGMILTLIQPATAGTGMDISTENLTDKLGTISLPDENTITFDKATWLSNGDTISLIGTDGLTYMETPLVAKGTDGIVRDLSATISADQHTVNLGALGATNQASEQAYTENLQNNAKRFNYDPMPLVNAYGEFVNTAMRNDTVAFLGNFAVGAATGFAIAMLMGVSAAVFLTVLNVIIIGITAVVAFPLLIPYLIISAILLVPVAVSIPFLIASSAALGTAAGMAWSLYRAQDSSDPEAAQAATTVINIAQSDWDNFVDQLPILES